jgi:hypothetical protein
MKQNFPPNTGSCNSASLAAEHQQIVAVLFRVRSITTAHDQNIKVIDFNPVSMLDQTFFTRILYCIVPIVSEMLPCVL